jgi:hypothetical protein
MDSMGSITECNSAVRESVNSKGLFFDSYCQLKHDILAVCRCMIHHDFYFGQKALAQKNYFSLMLPSMLPLQVAHCIRIARDWPRTVSLRTGG